MRRRRRRWLSGTGRGPSRRRHLTALVAAEDGTVGSSGRRATIPRRWAASSHRSRDDPRRRPDARTVALGRHTSDAQAAQTGTPSPHTVSVPAGGWGLGTGTTQDRGARSRHAPGRTGGRARRAAPRAGHEVAHVPLVAVEPLGDDPIDVTGYDWVVLTSANGARQLRRRMRGTPRRVAAIGQATADAFGGADLVAETSTQEGLLDELPEAPGRVLFAAAEGARRVLPDALDADVLPLYRTIELDPPDWPEADLVVLMSPSAARALARVTRDLPVVSIGPETSRAARDAGVTVACRGRSQRPRRGRRRGRRDARSVVDSGRW